LDGFYPFANYFFPFIFLKMRVFSIPFSLFPISNSTKMTLDLPIPSKPIFPQMGPLPLWPISSNYFLFHSPPPMPNPSVQFVLVGGCQLALALCPFFWPYIPFELSSHPFIFAQFDCPKRVLPTK
jgi:hypothetical protein